MGPTLAAFEETGIEVCESLSTFHFRTSHYEYTSCSRTFLWNRQSFLEQFDSDTLWHRFPCFTSKTFRYNLYGCHHDPFNISKNYHNLPCDKPILGFPWCRQTHGTCTLTWYSTGNVILCSSVIQNICCVMVDRLCVSVWLSSIWQYSTLW